MNDTLPAATVLDSMACAQCPVIAPPLTSLAVAAAPGALAPRVVTGPTSRDLARGLSPDREPEPPIAVERRLAACLHADISGYCRLIADDVQATVRTLTAYQAVMAILVGRHGGRVVDTAGDSVLAEFPGAACAVRCAVAIQCALGVHNAGLPASRRLEFRVGIDLGEVLVQHGRLYGDCVNVAARVQELAAPGSICLAGTAYDRLDSAVPVRFQYLGEHRVRNIQQPLRIYGVEWRRIGVERACHGCARGTDVGSPGPVGGDCGRRTAPWRTMRQ